MGTAAPGKNPTLRQQSPTLSPPHKTPVVCALDSLWEATFSEPFFVCRSDKSVSTELLEMMMSENFPSPNAIPPRTSSTGLSNSFLTPTKAVLRPVPEADWLAPSPQKRLHSHSMSYSSGSSPSPGPDPFITIGDARMSVERKSWSLEKEKILLGPFEYMYHHPGKNIRTQLITAFNEWLRVPAESLEIITKVVGMLHTASLL